MKKLKKIIGIILLTLLMSVLFIMTCNNGILSALLIWCGSIAFVSMVIFAFYLIFDDTTND